MEQNTINNQRNIPECDRIRENNSAACEQPIQNKTKLDEMQQIATGLWNDELKHKQT